MHLTLLLGAFLSAWPLLSILSFNCSNQLPDVLAAAGYLSTHHDTPRLFIGLSLGGAAALHAASKYPQAEAVVAIATPSNLTDITTRFDHVRPLIAADGIAKLEIRGRKFSLKEKFFSALESTDMIEPVRELGRPLLIIHSTADEIVDVCHAEELFAVAERPKSLIMLEGVDHLISEDAKAEHVAKQIYLWLQEVL